MGKKGIIASVAGAGALIGAGIGEKAVPVEYKLTPDTSWHINNLDGTTSFTNAAVEALNTSGHNTAMAIGAGIGAITAGVGAYKYLKNRNLGRQFEDI